MTPVPAFLDWLGPRRATIALLREYLASLGEEWLKSEHKAATADIDAGLRKEVVALHNSRGGELYLGVDRSKTVVGTAVTIDRLRQVLAQRDRAPPNDRCLTDLNLAVAQPLVIEDADGRAIILDVRSTGKAGLFLADDNSLQLCYRRGDETLTADAGGVIGWYRAVRKEEILITCYLELRAFSSRIRRWATIPGFLPADLPYLSRCMSDGSLYTFLSDEEIRALIGGASPDGNGTMNGFASWYLSVVRQALAIYEQTNIDMSVMSINDAIQRTDGRGLSLGDYQVQLDTSVTQFRDWLSAKGIDLA